MARRKRPPHKPKPKPKRKPKPPQPTPAPTPTPAPGGSTLQPVAGTVTPLGSTGVADQAAGGDMTGTSALNALFIDSVFGTGGGPAPQYGWQERTAQQVQADQITATGQPVSTPAAAPTGGTG